MRPASPLAAIRDAPAHLRALPRRVGGMLSLLIARQLIYEFQEQVLGIGDGKRHDFA